MERVHSPVSRLGQVGLATPTIAALRARLMESIERSSRMVARASLWSDRVGLVLLMLAVGTLLFRPADMFPVLAGKPIYEVLVGACLVATLPRLLQWLTARALLENGVAALILMLVPAVMLSHLAHADTYDARMGGLEVLKASLLFMLVVSLVTTPKRFRAMLLAVGSGVFAMTALSVLQFHGRLHLTGLTSIEQRSLDPNDPSVIVRLCGLGVFNDPNDLALILVIAMGACVYGLGEERLGRARPLLLAPLALLAYALILTHSRGGLMSAGAALLALLTARVGWKNMLPLILCLLVVAVFVPSWGRETSVDFGSPEDTFQTRLDLWSDSLDCFRGAPILGIGQGKLADTIGAVTHNSFLHAFAEMGMFGGAVFIGAFYFAVRGVWRVGSGDAQVARLRPFVLAIIVGYATGLLSLSRCYTVPTQLVLALATAYLAMAQPGGAALPRLDFAGVRRITVVSVVFLAATYVFVRVMLRPGAI